MALCDSSNSRLGMVEQLTFHADAALIARLGRELVARQETALLELIKNSYDADATEVSVAFTDRGGPNAMLEIRDNGSGMSRETLIDGFLRLASDFKVKHPRSSRFDRMRAGRKGIGRFSTQRLGDRLVLTTYARGERQALRLTADWTLFSAGSRLEDIAVQLEEIDLLEPGTTVRIEGLQDNWSNTQIRNCWRGVLALQQPFPVKPIEPVDAPIAKNKPEPDPGFSVRFLDNGGLFGDPSVIADMKTEILDHMPAIIDMRVDHSGHASWRISKNMFGETRDWRRIHHDHRDDPDPPAYKALRDVSMRAYHVVLDPQYLTGVVLTRVRDFFRNDGGIRLYRNGFRVVPYGNADDDWLGLDAIYGRRDFLAPVANRNFFGVIEVDDPKGDFFDEHTSREGLIETAALSELKHVASAVLITAATEMAADRGRKIRTSTPPPDIGKSEDLSAARAALRLAREAAHKISKRGTVGAQDVLDSADEADRLIEQAEVRHSKEQARYADEAAMLRLLASIGMTTAEFSHETGMAFEAFRLDLDQVLVVATQARSNDPAFAKQALRASEAIRRLDTLTAYLNLTVASRALREIHPVSLSRAVEDFVKGIRAHAETQSTTIEIDTPGLDALRTVPMHEAELASVLLNFHTNALKAMKRTKAPRRILVTADRIVSKGMVRLRFCDTGDGVAEAARERIFDAFFTTTAAPSSSASELEHAQGTGLGLWIVNQIAQNVGGEVAVVDPPKGYSTCFEMLIPAEHSDG